MRQEGDESKSAARRAKPIDVSLWAEPILGQIALMNKLQRQRLGMLLARKRDDFLPGYKVVRTRGQRQENDLGLIGKSAQLIEFLRHRGQPHRNDIMREMWPAEARVGTNLNDNRRLRSKLRMLISRTNREMKTLTPVCEIRRSGPTYWLVERK